MAPERGQGRGFIRLAFLVNGISADWRFEALYTLFRHLPPEEFFLVLVTGNPAFDVHDIFQSCLFFADHIAIIFRDDDAAAVEKLNRLSLDILVDMDAYGPSDRLPVFLAAHAPCKLLWGEAAMPPLEPEVKTLAGACLNVEAQLPAVTLPGLGEYWEFPEIPFTGEDERQEDAPVLGVLTPAASISKEGWQFLAEVLLRVPDSRLLINLETLGGAAQHFIAGEFSRKGVGQDRLEFIKVSTKEALCRAWQGVDLGLAVPVNPGDLALPACLWMGKPYLALSSPLPWARRPAALLEAVGKPEWVAQDREDYFSKAAQFIQKDRVSFDPALRAQIKAFKWDDPLAFAQGFAKTLHHFFQTSQNQGTP